MPGEEMDFADKKAWFDWFASLDLFEGSSSSHQEVPLRSLFHGVLSRSIFFVFFSGVNFRDAILTSSRMSK